MRDVKHIITLPKPCDADWEQMTPTDRGRHCAQCCKTVVDFTLLSDGEILDIFKKAKTNPPCGHFLETQLDRELVDTRYKPSFFSLIIKRAAAMLIVFHSVTVAALAQQVKKTPVAQHADKEKTQVKDSRRQICGHVFHYADGAPIEGVKVKIRGTQIEAMSDRYGMFVLTLPDSFYMANLVIEGSIASNAPTETIIEETINIDDIINNKEIKLFAYKSQTLPVHKVVRNKYQPVKLSGIAPMHVKVVPTESGIWNKVKQPFKKRNRS